MCGIIAGFNTSENKGKKKIEKINNFIIDQFQDQCSRGTKGFGIIRIDEKGGIEVDRATEEIKFLLDLYLKPARMIIAHHRQPTSSENKMSQTHPIFISNKMLDFDYYFVHNGVISNDTKLKTKHTEMGFKYITEHKKEGYYAGSTPTIKFNDSEALAIEVALFIEKKQELIGTDNTAAFIALQIDKKTGKARRVFFGRNGNSSMLNMLKIKGTIKISSEGEGEEVEVNKLWSFDPKDPKMKLTSSDMEFKEIKPIVETPSPYSTAGQPVPTNLLVNQAVEGTKLTTSDNAELVTIPMRKWAEDKELVYDEEEEEETFVDKNYKAELLQDFKETIKEDEADMIETSLDVALDDQVEKIGKIITNFQKILMQRKLDSKERGFYISQTFQILSAMEAIADAAEEDFEEKKMQEQMKAAEEDYEESMIGFRMGRQVHHHRRAGEDPIDPETGTLNFNDFG